MVLYIHHCINVWYVTTYDITLTYTHVPVAYDTTTQQTAVALLSMMHGYLKEQCVVQSITYIYTLWYLCNYSGHNRYMYVDINITKKH